jgi:hypothetical protein
MPTTLNLKDFVADQLGTGNGSTSVPKRDRIINQARRKYYSERRWNFLFKSATVTITAQLGTLPTDYNKKFDPIGVYTYSGNTKYQYDKVEWEDLSYYSDADYVYAIDKGNGQIKINQSISSITMDYTHLPADRPINTSEDSQNESAPDITAMGYLAIAMWWLASERNDDNYKLFKAEYDKQLQSDVIADGSSQAVKPIIPRRLPLKTGYRGRRG